MAWALCAILSVLLGGSIFLLRRAWLRLVEFDDIFRVIVDPMQEYAEELRRIATAEGLLHDHPEVIAFHRANMKMLNSVNAAIESLKQVRPPADEPKGLPPEVA